MHRHVTVIGAGPGGLATGMLLRAAGLEVTILEKLDRVGGRTSAITANGFRFDTGPTFFLFPQILSDIFATAGYDFELEVPMIRLDPQYRLVFGGGGELLASPNVRRLQAEVAKISSADARNVPRFLSDNRQKLEAFQPVLQSAFNGWSDLFRRDMLASLPLVRPWLSLDHDLRRYFSDPRIRLAFSFQSKYLGMSPYQCPSLFSILSFIEYEYGVHHPIGGCSAVTERMARLFVEMGGRIRLNEPVRNIAFRGRRAVGVDTEAGFYPSDAVVMNADFARAAMRMVPEHLRRRWSNRRIATRSYSCSTFMLYLGIDGVYRDIPHHNIYIAKDYEEKLKDIEKRHVLSEDPSFYLHNPSVTDPTLAPPGKSALYLLVPVTHQTDNIDWSKEAGCFRNIALKQLSRIGIPDIERRIVYERMFTPDEWSDQYDLHLGSTFSMAHSLRQMLHLRPRNRFEDVDGVYLVGGGTHPGSGLPVIFESARISSRLLVEDLGVAAPSAMPVRRVAPIIEEVA